LALGAIGTLAILKEFFAAPHALLNLSICPEFKKRHHLVADQ